MPAGTKDRIFWGIGRVLAKHRRNEILATETRWRLLKVLNIYRMLVASASIAVSLTPLFARHLDIQAPYVVAVTGSSYLLLGLVSIALLARQWPGLTIQSELQPLLDLVALTIITQGAGAQISLFVFLLIPPVAAAAASALNLRRAVFFAALCALITLGATLGAGFSQDLAVLLYTRAGLFALGLIAVAIGAHQMATRLFETEALAEKRGIEVRELDAINRRIIAQLRTGVMITDSNGDILRANPAATGYVTPQLRSAIARLAGREARQGSSVFERDSSSSLLLTVVPLNPTRNARRLVFLEDNEVAHEQARAMKLAALGRLTAGIAHQVRNPLSAIAHANELMREDGTLDGQQQHLSRIIANQSARLGGMVESILKLSRRDTVQPALIELNPWLGSFLRDYSERHPEQTDRLRLVADGMDGAEVRFDPGQLEHVVVNLVDNAFLHGDSDSGVSIRVGFDRAHVYLDVLDRGPGIAQPERLFEPFATTRTDGTGLGLYLAHELAVANNAQLNAHARKGGGTRFRLEFAQDKAWLE